MGFKKHHYITIARALSMITNEVGLGFGNWNIEE